MHTCTSDALFGLINSFNIQSACTAHNPFYNGCVLWAKQTRPRAMRHITDSPSGALLDASRKHFRVLATVAVFVCARMCLSALVLKWEFTPKCIHCPRRSTAYVWCCCRCNVIAADAGKFLWESRWRQQLRTAATQHIHSFRTTLQTYTECLAGLAMQMCQNSCRGPRTWLGYMEFFGWKQMVQTPLWTCHPLLMLIQPISTGSALKKTSIVIPLNYHHTAPPSHPLCQIMRPKSPANH